MRTFMLKTFSQKHGVMEKDMLLKYTDISKVFQWIHERGGGMRMK